MDGRLLRQFQRHVADNCDYALRASEEGQAALNRGDVGDFWRAAQNIIVSAGNVSKALWGSGGEGKEEREARRAPLRESLGVSDDSILKPTTFRNHLEHYDERLDEWDRKSAPLDSYVHVDRNLGPKSMWGNVKSWQVFRNYDPATGELTFWGTTLSLPELVAELQAIRPRAAAEADKPWTDYRSTSGGG